MGIDDDPDRGLPRPTYSNEKSARIEDEVAQAFAVYARCDQVKIGKDKRGEMKSRVDRAAIRDNVIVAFFEIKTTNLKFRQFPSYVTGERKLLSLRKFQGIVYVPVYYVVRFGCGTMAMFDVNAKYERIPVWGRTDRGDARDIEPGASFAWDDLIRL